MGQKGSGTERTKSTEVSGQEGDGAVEHREARKATEGLWAQLTRSLGGWIQSHIKPLEGSIQGEDMIRSAFLKFPSGDSLVVWG